MMSVGSNLLAMLNGRASIQTSGTEPQQKQHRASQQMRRCMKNFNFKLDYNEIDRIIEEHDEEGLAPKKPNEETKELAQPEGVHSSQQQLAPQKQ